MRIISKYKDYYDGGEMYGIDNTRIYVREEKIIPYKCELWSNEFDIIGFCGELFPIIDYSNNVNHKTHIFYTNFRYEMSICIENKLIECAKNKINYRNKTYNSLKNNKEYKLLFFQYKVPIFILKLSSRYKELILNPQLKEYNFATIYDTTQAFQKIEQYISNQLVSDNQGNINTGNNEIIGRSKGFNEYSFRNAKNKPKKF